MRESERAREQESKRTGEQDLQESKGAKSVRAREIGEREREGKRSRSARGRELKGKIARVHTDKRARERRKSKR
jgi:hypothetical protein